jgi:hypothetical protein
MQYSSQIILNNQTQHPIIHHSLPVSQFGPCLPKCKKEEEQTLVQESPVISKINSQVHDIVSNQLKCLSSEILTQCRFFNATDVASTSLE